MVSEEQLKQARLGLLQQHGLYGIAALAAIAEVGFSAEMLMRMRFLNPLSKHSTAGFYSGAFCGKGGGTLLGA